MPDLPQKPVTGESATYSGFPILPHGAMEINGCSGHQYSSLPPLNTHWNHTAHAYRGQPRHRRGGYRGVSSGPSHYPHGHGVMPSSNSPVPEPDEQGAIALGTHALGAHHSFSRESSHFSDQSSISSGFNPIHLNYHHLHDSAGSVGPFHYPGHGIGGTRGFTRREAKYDRMEELLKVRAEIKKERRALGYRPCQWQLYGCRNIIILPDQESPRHEDICEFRCHPEVHKLWTVLRNYQTRYQDFKPDLWGAVAPKAHTFMPVGIHDKALIPNKDEPLVFDPADLWDKVMPSQYIVSHAVLRNIQASKLDDVDVVTLMHQLQYPKEHQPRDVQYILDVKPKEHNAEYPLSVPVYLDTPHRVGYIGYNVTPLHSYVDLHVDRGQDTVCTVFGDAEKLWLLWPPTKENETAYYKRAFSVDTESVKFSSRLINVAPHLSHGRIIRTNRSMAIHIPAGWLHAVLTLTGGFLVGYTWSAPDRLGHVLRSLRHEVQFGNSISDLYDTVILAVDILEIILAKSVEDELYTGIRSWLTLLEILKIHDLDWTNEVAKRTLTIMENLSYRGINILPKVCPCQTEEQKKQKLDMASHLLDHIYFLPDRTQSKARAKMLKGIGKDKPTPLVQSEMQRPAPRFMNTKQSESVAGKETQAVSQLVSSSGQSQNSKSFTYDIYNHVGSDIIPDTLEKNGSARSNMTLSGLSEAYGSHLSANTTAQAYAFAAKEHPPIQVEPAAGGMAPGRAVPNTSVNRLNRTFGGDETVYVDLDSPPATESAISSNSVVGLLQISEVVSEHRNNSRKNSVNQGSSTVRKLFSNTTHTAGAQRAANAEPDLELSDEANEPEISDTVNKAVPKRQLKIHEKSVVKGIIKRPVKSAPKKTSKVQEKPKKDNQKPTTVANNTRAAKAQAAKAQASSAKPKLTQKKLTKSSQVKPNQKKQTRRVYVEESTEEDGSGDTESEGSEEEEEEEESSEYEDTIIVAGSYNNDDEDYESSS